MSTASQSTQQKFPFPYDAVFDAVVASVDDVGFSLKSEDRVIGRVVASTGMSLFSWGENVTVVVEKVSDASTLVAIDSSLKVGVNLAGNHRHTANFEKLIAATSKRLQSAGV